MESIIFDEIFGQARGCSCKGLHPGNTHVYKNRLLPLSWFSDIYSFNILLLFRFSGVFPSVNAAIKRRDQALQVCYLLLKRNDFTC